MSKALTLGNGNILVNLNDYGFVSDFYFPYVGLENHVGNAFAHRIGVYVDGVYSWLDDGSWEITIRCEDEALVGNTLAVNRGLDISLSFFDLCYNESNVFIRKIQVKNGAVANRRIKVFFIHQFEFYESHVAHTAYYDPENHVIIHYRNQRAFLVNAELDGQRFDDYSTGVFKAEGKEGTFRDAEDGELADNPIEHGRADSGIALAADYTAGEIKSLDYWMAVGLSTDAVVELNKYVLSKGISHLLESTRNFWRAWVNRQNFNFYGLTDDVVKLFKHSLFYIRAHVDRTGAIIASGDSSMLQKGKDTYAYVWPRDGCYVSMALDRAGDFNISRRFFEFLHEIIAPEGYFMHKYSPDKSLGSSWHAWVRDNHPQLPIQEDETAIVLYALWQHYELSKDLEFVEGLYNTVIMKAADFLTTYRDEKTGLPRPSFDLWEEKFGVHTYTAASVYGALMCAARFAQLLGKIKNEHRWRAAASEIKEAILDKLFDQDRGVFYKSVKYENDDPVYDKTLDISTAYGLMFFDVLPVTDPRLAKTMDEIFNRLAYQTGVGGLGRYDNDLFYRVDPSLPGNPWFVTTLWYAQYTIAQAKQSADLEEAKRWLMWAVNHAKPSGILSEQIDPISGEQLSAGPLVWSHAEFVKTVIAYLDKLEELGVCKACNPVY